MTEDNEIAPCTKCGSVEPPDEIGRCATCGSFRVGNVAALTADDKMTPADFAERDALIDSVLATRGGRDSLDVVSIVRVEHYAFAVVQCRKVAQKLATSGPRESHVTAFKIWSERVEKLGAELPPVITPTKPNLRNVSEDDLIAASAAHIAKLQRFHDAAVGSRDTRLRCEAADAIAAFGDGDLIPEDNDED